MKSIFLAAISAAMSFGTAAAETNLSAVQGAVMVNSGTGYQPVSAITSLKPGDRVLVNAKSSGQLSFADGCSVKLAPGIVTIGKKSPCMVKAQPTGNFAGMSTGAIIAAGFGVVALGAGIYAITKDDKTVQTFTSP